MENVSFVLVMIRNFTFLLLSALNIWGDQISDDILLPLIANVKPKFETSLLIKCCLVTYPPDPLPLIREGGV